MNKGQLYRLNIEIQQASHTGVGYLLRSKINEFYKEHGVRLNGIIAEVQAIEKEYFVIENGQYKMGEDKQPIFIEGKLRENYENEINTLFAKELTDIRIVKN